MSDEINNFPHLKAGDRVKLTGEDWGLFDPEFPEEVVIEGRTYAGALGDDVPYFTWDEYTLYIYRGNQSYWDAELVEPKEDLLKELHDYLAAVGEDAVSTSPTRAEEAEAVAILLEEAKTDVSVRYEDPINPEYYKFPSGAEVKNISMYLTSCGGQALQYIARSTRLDGRNKGNPVENLRKAIEVINWEINRLEGK